MTRGRPTPEAVAADLEARIRAGEWAPGTRLPARRALAVEVGGTYVARRALELLVERGLAVARFGGGTTVADPLPAPGVSLEALAARVAELEAWRRNVGG